MAGARGSGANRFRSPDAPSDGRGVALAADAIDLLDALGLDSVPVVGHDWGARVAYTLAAVAPERVSSIVALALPYQPRGAFTIAQFEQARAFWYQWLLYLDAGAHAVAADPVSSRFLADEARDPHYEPLAQRLAEDEQIATPTLMIQGAEDRCDLPAASENQEQFFTGGYRRLVLEGVGHFPHREAPDDVAQAIDRHLQTGAARRR